MEMQLSYLHGYVEEPKIKADGFSLLEISDQRPDLRRKKSSLHLRLRRKTSVYKTNKISNQQNIIQALLTKPMANVTVKGKVTRLASWLTKACDFFLMINAHGILRRYMALEKRTLGTCRAIVPPGPQ